MRSWGLRLYTLHRHAERIPVLDLEMGNMVKVQHYEMWAVGTQSWTRAAQWKQTLSQRTMKVGCSGSSSCGRMRIFMSSSRNVSKQEVF